MNTTILDYIVNTIEALFYILTGVIALLTYLSARKTILQPVKTEVFKRQVEVFSSIMELFNGKAKLKSGERLALIKCLRRIFCAFWMNMLLFSSTTMSMSKNALITKQLALNL